MVDCFWEGKCLLKNVRHQNGKINFTSDFFIKTFCDTCKSNFRLLSSHTAFYVAYLNSSVASFILLPGKHILYYNRNSYNYRTKTWSSCFLSEIVQWVFKNKYMHMFLMCRQFAFICTLNILFHSYFPNFCTFELIYIKPESYPAVQWNILPSAFKENASDIFCLSFSIRFIKFQLKQHPCNTNHFTLKIVKEKKSQSISH